MTRGSCRSRSRSRTRKGALLDSAIPKVSVIKDGNYVADDFDSGIESQVDVLALIDLKLRQAPLAGFVLEGLSPYGTTDVARAASGAAARRLQRHAGRARRPRQQRGLQPGRSICSSAAAI